MSDRIAQPWRIGFAVLGALIVMVSLIPLVQSNIGLIRIWDFPRPQIAVLGAGVLIGLLCFRAWRRWWGIAVLAAVSGAVIYQIICIAPYTPFSSLQVATAEKPSNDRCMSLFTANVHQTNRKTKTLLHLIEKYDPDILLILETNKWWQNALHSVAERYPQVRAEILNNTYGLIFMTKLYGTIEIRHLVEPGIPSIKADLHLPSGHSFTFYGLHPEPPRIQQSTEERDTELITVAKQVRQDQGPAMVAGDLNDVAWSHTTRLFRQISRMVDPRIGRGLFSSFHADHWFLRWPLDHIFHSQDFLFSRLEVLPHIGSDHFPVFGRFCLAPRADSLNKEPDLAGPSDREQAHEAVE